MLSRWIDQGANWPAAGERGAALGMGADRPSLSPAVKRADWPANDIDRFVLARLEKENVAPSPDASRSPCCAGYRSI